MTTSSKSNASMVRDLPPHLPLFNILELEAPKELTLVANPIYKDEVPENLHPTLHQTENLPGLFALHHVNQAMAKERIIKGDTFLSSLGNCGILIFWDQPTRLMWALR